MTKMELIDSLTIKLKRNKSKDSSPIKKHEVRDVVFSLFETMSESLEKGRRVEVRGFGSFKVIKGRTSNVRNPKTGAKLKITPSSRPRFKAGKDMKERVDVARKKSKIFG